MAIPKSSAFLLVRSQSNMRGWIQQNIAAFGGDPHDVTMFGVSEGSNLNAGLLGAPGAAGLFDKVILESLVGAGVNNTTRAQAEANAMNSIHSLDTNATNPLGCLAQEGNPADLLACLQALPAVQALRIASPGLIIDGSTIPLFTTPALTTGQFNRVPMIIGSNQTEGTFFSNTTRTEAQYEALLSDQGRPHVLLVASATKWGGHFHFARRVTFQP